MGDRGRAIDPLRWTPLAGVAALLVMANLLVDVLAPDLYLLWTSMGVVGLALLARADGMGPSQWGLGPVQRRAALAALVLALVTAAAMLVGTQLPGVSSAFADERVSGVSAADVAFAALVRAPLGTAVFEEVAFRGVLLAMLARRFGSGWGVAGSSLAFGLWHVVPSLGIAGGNAAVGSAFGGHSLWAAAAGVVAATLVGVFLCLLRTRYDHLVVPAAVHAAANGLGYLLAWLAVGA